MQSLKYKLVELFVLFILTPITFALNYSPYLKLTIGTTGFVYVVYVLLKVEQNKFRMASNLNWKSFWRRTLLHFVIIAIVTAVYVWIKAPDQLFSVMLCNSKLWLFILFFYSLFSVYPQELIYRTFFFQRYESLFTNKSLLIFFNAIVFALAHVFFKNSLVIFLTFIGGLLFAMTFHKTKSTIMVSIEHAIYGCWLFTVGMGNMLGFPS